MADYGKGDAALSNLGKNRKAQFTECVQGLVREQLGGHASPSCNSYSEHQFDHTHYVAFGAATAAEIIHEQKAATSGLFNIYERIKRAIIQAVSKPKNPNLRPEGSSELLDFKKTEGAFPFKNVASLLPFEHALETPGHSMYEPNARSARPLSIVLENAVQTSQTVIIPPSSAAAQKMEAHTDVDEVDRKMKEEMAEYEGNGARFGGITRNGRGTNRKREPPKRIGPYRKPDDGLSKDPFIGPLQRSLSNAKKDLKRTLSKPPFTPPPPKPSAEASVSSDYFAHFWGYDSDNEIQTSRSTVEKENSNCTPLLE